MNHVITIRQRRRVRRFFRADDEAPHRRRQIAEKLRTIDGVRPYLHVVKVDAGGFALSLRCALTILSSVAARTPSALASSRTRSYPDCDSPAVRLMCSAVAGIRRTFNRWCVVVGCRWIAFAGSIARSMTLRTASCRIAPPYR